MSPKLMTPALALIWLAACGQPPAAPPADAVAPQREEAGFVLPPQVVLAQRSREGGVLLTGHARPEASVRLASPGGRAFAAIADDQGAWRMEIPPLADATLFGLSTQSKGRGVQAEGYVALLPPPGRPAALLRAGAGAAVVGAAAGSLAIEAVDIDSTGAAVISGRSPGGLALTAHVDGATAGQGTSAQGGGYELALLTPLPAGQRRLTVRGGDREAVLDLPVRAPRAPAAGPYVAERLDNAWRIDWMTPGGGLQSSILLDPGHAR